MLCGGRRGIELTRVAAPLPSGHAQSGCDGKALNTASSNGLLIRQRNALATSGQCFYGK